MVGLGKGYPSVGGPDLPPGVRVRFSFGRIAVTSTKSSSLRQAGLLKAEITTFPFEDLPRMYDELAAGRRWLVGRGVAVMPGIR